MGSPFSALPSRARPRERLLSEGREALSDTELLALQLRSGTTGASASDLATALLAEFGSLRRLGEATVEELARLPGVGNAKACSVVAAFELGRRLPLDDQPEVSLARASDVAQRARHSLAGLRRERAIVFVCDRRARLLHEVQLSQGTAARSLIEVREVLNAVLRHDGAAFGLAHNHPSGDPRPSQADVELTQDVASAAKTVGLRFLGHIVIAGDEWAEVKIRPSQRRLG
ncbi:RadC family protein [Candidatus Poriferisocius sp.]|uniref:RadC family protein n=1 Tax=Candidatus Poriferisocius sp. TaxID=3101276 RepID=UPI003B591519